MGISAGEDSIGVDEILYRKIPISTKWFDDGNGVSPLAFRPREDDTDGISVDRGKYRTIAEAAQGSSASGYVIALLRVSELFSRGIKVVPDRIEGNDGHAIIKGITYPNKKSTPVLEAMQLLATELTFEVRSASGEILWTRA